MDLPAIALFFFFYTILPLVAYAIYIYNELQKEINSNL